MPQHSRSFYQAYKIAKSLAHVLGEKKHAEIQAEFRLPMRWVLTKWASLQHHVAKDNDIAFGYYASIQSLVRSLVL